MLVEFAQHDQCINAGYAAIAINVPRSPSAFLELGQPRDFAKDRIGIGHVPPLITIGIRLDAPRQEQSCREHNHSKNGNQGFHVGPPFNITIIRPEVN